MDPRIACYLRTHRRRWQLTQRELAFLLGIESPSQVSRCEKLRCSPTTRFIVGSEIIFDEHPSRLFPQFYAEVEDETMRRAYELFTKIEESPDGEPSAKRDLLLQMANRTSRERNNFVQ